MTRLVQPTLAGRILVLVLSVLAVIGLASCSRGPRIITLNPHLRYLRPQHFIDTRIQDDGKTLEVRFLQGKECGFPARIELREGSASVEIAAFVGDPLGVRACITNSRPTSARVTLEAPLEGRRVVDGARSGRKPWGGG